MKLVVISSAPVVLQENEKFLYAPYEKEMQLWAKYTDEIELCCPVWKEDKKLLITKVTFPMLPVIELKEFDVLSLKNAFLAIPSILQNAMTIYKAMKKADHIHLRCPGNMALIASVVQIAFPKKKKTAKYAGNWDPNSKQPLSYRLQKWILSNTLLTQNMQVLVYGEWPKQTQNIKPFFTATYTEKEILNSEFRIQSLEFQNEIKFIFVGTLSKGKQPLYVVKLVEQLYLSGKKVSLDFYGEGVLRKELEQYIQANALQELVHLKGNQTKETIKEAYQKSHFLLLPSKSEGWPKVVAEAMFWGCVPIATPVSCVPYMVDYGNRGVLLTENLNKDIVALLQLVNNSSVYELKSKAAQNWSQHYTTDLFEAEIKKLLKA